MLDIFKERNAKPLATGDPLKESVVSLYRDLLAQVTDKVLMDRLRESYKTPANLAEMCVPKMNAELWSALESSPTLSVENSLYSSMEPIVCSLIATARLVEVLSSNAALLPKDLGNSMMTLISDCAAGLAVSYRDFNHRRRMNFKNRLSFDVRGICSSRVKITENLFGDTLTEDMKAAKTAALISKNSKLTRGNSYVRGNNGFRGRGFKPQGHFNNRQNNLNFQTPPPLYFRGRGGRNRHKRRPSHQKKHQQQQYHTNNNTITNSRCKYT